MKEPVDHIIRPRLPWRSPDAPAITECGYNAANVKAITREDFFQRVKDLGQQRCAMLTCMTCSDTARRWKTWDEEPRHAIEREITWECLWGRQRNNERGDLLRQELIAIEKLIEAHRDEFEAIVTDNENHRQQRREWLEKKLSRGKPKTPMPKPTGLL